MTRHTSILRPRAKARPATPEWIITYADLMSLLLCFFILLQVFSELKRDDDYQRVVGGVRDAFGYDGGVGRSPVDATPLGSIIDSLEGTADRQEVHDRLAPTPIEGIPGLHVRVTRVREGLMFTLGGTLAFGVESAEISPAMRVEIQKLATLLAGRKNLIVIRGHAANKYLAPDSRWADLHELSYARARAVLGILVECGIPESSCRIEAAGRSAPLSEGESESAVGSANRRVDIILTEDLIEDLPAERTEVPAHAPGL